MERLLTRLVVILAALLTAAIVVIIALGFLCFAAYLALLGQLSPPIAALVTAGGALLLALLIVLLGRGISAILRPRPKRGDRWASIFGGVIGEELAARAAKHPHSALIASLLSGFALGASPELRHLLRDLLVRS